MHSSQYRLSVGVCVGVFTILCSYYVPRIEKKSRERQQLQQQIE